MRHSMGDGCRAPHLGQGLLSMPRMVGHPGLEHVSEGVELDIADIRDNLY
jgi:hypothetical protein